MSYGSLNKRRNEAIDLLSAVKISLTLEIGRKS